MVSDARTAGLLDYVQFGYIIYNIMPNGVHGFSYSSYYNIMFRWVSTSMSTDDKSRM